ncbi:WD repeat-containing protein 36 [Senna tora]|uniref:WD repeat-containing protein 36 n=1 Tax=Senna tora TaxID=362788 RepID=A0A834W7I8_9FABA|nr:WD repeat-containing protein 36 [Senna tora]
MGIFEPYRAIGYITSSVPISIQRLGTETFVTVSVGKAFQIYNCAKLNLILVGPQLPKKIRALASYREYTFAAYGNDIAVFKRAHQVATWSRHNARVNVLLLFGEHILSVDAHGNMFIWAFKGNDQNLAPIGHIMLDDKFNPSCIMHPDTYLNKVLIGSEKGPMQLWNISTKKKIYEFKGWNSPISACVSSPALDVVAVGCADGSIHVHNIRYDEELVTFTHSTRGSVTALSFSTDGQPLLASGGSSGVVSIWNLEKKRLQSVIKDAHDSSITSLHFFANEPVLMSASADNSIKMWIFDTSDGDPRLLRFRCGHSAPPLCIKFYANGRHILSAGQDRAFRLFSVIQDQQSRELSQRHVSKRAKKLMVKEEEIKLKPVIAFDCAEIRERDWCNVVTCHMDTAQAYVWRLQNFVLGEHILKPCPKNPTPVKACAISACGNFALLGTAAGWIERFNLQSGLSRGAYIDMTEQKSCAHDGEVAGVACDSTNTLMISAGYHGDIKVWDFKERQFKSRWDIGCSVVKIIYHRHNGLLATVVDDFSIQLFDVVALRLVRKFEGHTDRITDLSFSEDGKWLVSSSMDGSLRVWDVVLARQIDAIQVDVPITALSLSPNMDILATTHADQNGVYLWVNQAMFSSTSNFDSYASGKEVVSIKLPSVSSIEDSQVEHSDKPMNSLKPNDAPGFPIQDKQIPDLVTLSLLPKSQWQSLINLDIIKARNKPIEPPKKPEKAPFFLPSVASISGEILFEPSKLSEKDKDETGNEAEINKRGVDMPPSRFLHLLQSSSKVDNCKHLNKLIVSCILKLLDVHCSVWQTVDNLFQSTVIQISTLIFIYIKTDRLVELLKKSLDFINTQCLVKLFLNINNILIRENEMVACIVKRLRDPDSILNRSIIQQYMPFRCVFLLYDTTQILAWSCLQ